MERLYLKVYRILTSLLLLGTSAASYGAVNHARISEQSAEKQAKSVQPGTTVHKELKHMRGNWIYIFSIRSEDKKIHQVQVDARSGKVLKKEQSKYEGWGSPQG